MCINNLFGQYKPPEIPDDEKVKITKEAEVPKGEYCDWCREQGTKIQPFINPWTDEVTRHEEYGWCQFYNEMLIAEKTDCCYPRYKKCLSCILATNEGAKIVGNLILMSMLANNYEREENADKKENMKKAINELAKVMMTEADKNKKEE